MCSLGGIIEPSVCNAFDEAVKAGTKAGKYVRQYRMYLANLGTEWSSLQYLRGTIERSVREARDRGEEIEDAVSRWQEDAGRMENDVQQLIGQVEARMHCFACSCPNIRWRYRLGKQAEEKIAAVKQLAAQGSQFDVISHTRLPPPELEFPYAENYVHLDSRTQIFEDIVGALKDPEVKMIGVYGQGGLGKTTLVETVAKKMLDDGTFKQVPLVAVSKDLNVKDIQKKLADRLNFTLDATEDEKGRAIKLWNKFKNGENYLIILDDIWEEVDLKAIGIPVMEGNIGCKVVLTSRNEDLLRIEMKADRNFRIRELSDVEAWDLFKKKVRNTIESRPEIDSLAQQVCRKCKGLPVAINALGAALEDKPVEVWKNALEKLERYMITNIEGINQIVWASLKLSYDMLGSSDAKSCFLLCCLFLEDAEISIDDLTRYCVANSLLSQNPHTLDEAGNVVRTVVDALKSASLLSTDYHENVVKIHDVIRDVGISIALEKEAFLVDHGALRWPWNSANGPSYKAMSLSFKSIKGLPDRLVYPQLKTLIVDNSKLLDLEVPDNFFDGMMQLEVLTFTGMRMQRLPSSLAKLAKLRMLNLNRCKLDDIAILKDLNSNLEVLSLTGSHIESLPLEIRQLTSLRVLDLQDCDELMVIPRGVISNLTSLEELYFPQNFSKWEVTTDKQQDTSSKENVSLEELIELLRTGKLTTLHIYIPDVMLLPKDPIFTNLKRFKISVDSICQTSKEISGRYILQPEGIQLSNEFITLVGKAEAVVLSKIERLKKMFHNTGVGNRFLNLKYLKVTSCVEYLEYLFSESTFAQIEQRQRELNLERRQRELERQQLVLERRQLELRRRQRELEPQPLPLPLRLRLHQEQMQKEHELMQDRQELQQQQQLMQQHQLIQQQDQEQELQQEEELQQQRRRLGFSLPSSALFNNLIVLIIEYCKSKYLFSPTITSKLVLLEELEVRSCKIMEGIVGFERDEVHSKVKFSKLKKLQLGDLPNLLSFYAQKEKMGTTMGSSSACAQPLFSENVILPVLEVLEVDRLGYMVEIWDKQSPWLNENIVSCGKLRDMKVQRCEKLTNLVPSNILPRLDKLQKLCVEGCPNIESMVFKNEKEGAAADDSTMIIPQLQYLRISDMENLKSFYSSSRASNAQPLFNHQVILPVLEVLEVDRLGNIVEIWDKQSPLVNENTVACSKLRDVKVQRCEKLTNLVPSNILPRLDKLQKLCVEGCPKIESMVFKNEKEGAAADDSTMIIPQLQYLRISDMENLKSFYSSSRASNAQSLFNHQVILPVLEVLEVDRLGNMVEIWDKQSPWLNENIVSCGKLRDVKVQCCEKLTNLVPSNILPRLDKLQKLCVEGCPKIEFMVFKNEKEGAAADYSTMTIPQLQYLTISNMENLKSFYSSSRASNAQSLFNHQVTFPRLEILELERCASLRNIFHPYMVKVLENLGELIVNDCSKMESVIDKEEEVQDGQQRKTDKTLFHSLSKLELRRLPELRTFCHFTCPLELTLLSKMVICDCPSMDSFSLGPVSTPNLSLKGFSRNG